MAQEMPLTNVLNLLGNPDFIRRFMTTQSVQAILPRVTNVHHKMKMQSVLPQLPPEIWLIVFSYATRIPGAFETSDYSCLAAYTRDCFGINLYARYHDTLETKLAISLVCKSWNALVQEFLFEYLVIKTGEQALHLSDCFGRWNSTSGLRHRPGWWTTRLDIALEDVHVWDDNHSKSLTYILNNCPNLRVFSTAFCCAEAYLFYPDVFIDALSPLRTQSKLRRVELQGDIQFVNTLVAQLAPSLEVLWLITPRRILKHDNLDIYLPKLHTFITSSTSRTSFSLCWHMPSLRAYLTQDLLNMEARLRTIGAQFQYLTVPHVSHTIPALSLCPNLRQLDLKFDGIIMVPFDRVPSHPCLECITIEGCPDFARPISWYSDVNSSQLDYLRTSLLTLTSQRNFPVLDCIRIILPLIMEPYEGKVPRIFLSIWEFWLEICVSRGIRVEVSLGADNQTANIWTPFVPDLLLRKM